MSASSRKQPNPKDVRNAACAARPSKATPPKLIRHYETLSPKETDELVGDMADFVVDCFLKKRAKPSTTADPKQAHEPSEPPHEPAHEPDEPGHEPREPDEP